MAMDFKSMTIEQLESFIQASDGEVQALKTQAREAHRVLDEKRAEEDVMKLNPAERKRLARALGAEGIASGETFGELGR